jgi:hemoglobin
MRELLWVKYAVLLMRRAALFHVLGMGAGRVMPAWRAMLARGHQCCGNESNRENPGNTMQTEATVFELAGGEARVRALVDCFYDLMDSDVQFAGIRAMHPPLLDGSRNKLFWFLCGWMGGPDYYAKRIGEARLRARHLPFAIGMKERDQWVQCMTRAIQEVNFCEPLRERLMESFANTADWMRNQAD